MCCTILLVLWVSSGVDASDVWAELIRREGVSGIAEKAARASTMVVRRKLGTSKNSVNPGRLLSTGTPQALAVEQCRTFVGFARRCPCRSAACPPMTARTSSRGSCAAKSLARKSTRDVFALAFHDIAPQAPVHILVVPKGPYCSFADFSAEASQDEIAGFIRAVGKIAKDLGLEASGYRLLANTGEHSGQEVPISTSTCSPAVRSGG